MKKFSAMVGLRVAVAMAGVLVTGIVAPHAYAVTGASNSLPVSAGTIPAAVLAKALKLTDDQRTKIETAQKPLMSVMDDLAKSRAEGTAVNTGSLQQMSEARREAETSILAVLTESQKEGLQPLVKKLGGLQQTGIPVGVYADLNLTDDQETRLLAIHTAAQRKMGADLAAMKASGTPLNRQTIADLYRSSETEVQTQRDAVLLGSQRRTLSNYLQSHPMLMGHSGTAADTP